MRKGSLNLEKFSEIKVKELLISEDAGRSLGLEAEVQKNENEPTEKGIEEWKILKN